jgi:hypothetical protein
MSGEFSRADLGAAIDDPDELLDWEVAVKAPNDANEAVQINLMVAGVNKK